MYFLPILAIWLILLWLLAYHNISLKLSLQSIGLGILINGLAFFELSSTLIVLALYSFLYVVLTTTKIRLKVWTQFLPKMLLMLPKMSSTERTALAAGTVWWDGEIFSGQPNWQRLQDIGKPALSAEEQAFMQGPLKTLCSMINDWDTTNVRLDLAPEIWQFINKEGFFALIIPKRYGGLEFSAYAHSEILACLAGRSITLTSTIAVPNSLGPAELLLHYGTEDQKNHYLPRLATGQEIPCFALTNPYAGSDATAIPDTGIICRENFGGKDTLGIRLNWDKRYITLAPVATVLGLAFKLKDPDGLFGQEKDVGITCALIPTNHPGVVIGNRHLPLTAPFQNGPIQGKNVFIPMDWIIGGPKQAGQGWKMLVECLSCGRAISLPSSASGGGRMLAAATSSYARIRYQFKQAIGQFEGIQEALARIGGNVYLMEAARKMTAHIIDKKEAPSVLGAIIKYHLTERSRQVGMDAMDVHAGKGIMMGPKNYLASNYKNAPVGITVEGANILTRNMIIFGQGAMRCHPHMMKILEALGHTGSDQIALLDKAIGGQLKYTFSNIARTVYFTIRGSLGFSRMGSKHTRSTYYQLNRASAAFALIADVCMLLLGGKLKFKERISARLGDLMSMQYLATMALKRFQDEGEQVADLPLFQWSVQETLAKYWQAMDALLRNFPIKPIAWLCRLMIMPFGQVVKMPSDKLDHLIAELMLSDNPSRERLLAGTYLDPVKLNEVGRQEQTFHLVLKTEASLQKISKARKDKIIQGVSDLTLREQALAHKIITQAEADDLVQRDKEIAHVISVDDFTKESLSTKHIRLNNPPSS